MIAKKVYVVTSYRYYFRVTRKTNSIFLFVSKGYVNGKIAFFIATDASDNGTAASITKNPGFKVNFAPALAFVPESSRQQGYEFINGVRGEGSFGSNFQ
jgi:hypothetical protein